MQRDFRAITGKTFDVIVIGGGIVGAGIARDTQLRGLTTLLLEKEDFGYGTTSRSTRLAHGGLRYLRQLEFGLVRQDLYEREVLMRIAPHLVYPLTFLIPIHSTILNFVMLMGVILYDVISYDKTLPNHRYLNNKKTLEQEPNLRVKNLRGSYIYYDCQVPFPERLNLENALSAAENGAIVVNHAPVTGIIKEGGRITGVEVKDELTGEILQAKGRIVVNAAGHWVDQIKDMVFKDNPPYLLRTKGIHIIVPKVSNNALVLFSPTDSRLFFVIPWEGYSLVGTTDTIYEGNLDAVAATREDVEYMLEGLHLAYPDVKMEDVYYTTAGLRSLALKPGKKASDTSRSHEVIDHSKRDRLDGLVTVLGGKITAYRAVAKDVADLVCRKLDNKSPCKTGIDTLPGAPALNAEEIDWLVKKECLPEEVITNLAHIYGSRCRQVLELSRQDKRGKSRINPEGPDIIAQIWYSVKEESCCTVSDFMMRRSGLCFRKDQGIGAVQAVANEMKMLLDWDQANMERQVADYAKTAALARQFTHA